MIQERPTGSNLGMTYMFAKTFVRNLEAMGQFYEAVLGVVPLFRHADEMFGRPIEEIGYMASYPGGPSLTLISYTDGEQPAPGEAVQGFTTTDLEAACQRAVAHGGTVPQPIRELPDFGIKVAFIIDPEGHINEVVEMIDQTGG